MNKTNVLPKYLMNRVALVNQQNDYIMNSNTPDQPGSKARLIKLRAEHKNKDNKSVVKINSTPDVVTQGTITVSKDFIDVKKSREGDTRDNFGRTPETDNGVNLDHRSASHDSDAANMAAILK